MADLADRAQVPVKLLATAAQAPVGLGPSWAEEATVVQFQEVEAADWEIPVGAVGEVEVEPVVAIAVVVATVVLALTVVELLHQAQVPEPEVHSTGATKLPLE